MEIHFGRGKRARVQRLKEAVLGLFCAEPEEACTRLGEFGEEAWRGALWWLDISGMALYTLARMRELGVADLLPAAIRARIQENLRQNQERTKALAQEGSEIAERFERAGIRFALLKGATLVPDSVPHGALRSQTDLDFLIQREQGPLAVAEVSALGYAVYDKKAEEIEHGRNEEEIELRAGAWALPDIENIYRVHGLRALELHLLAPNARSGRLARAVHREMSGSRMSTLAPADILVQQAIHLFMHFCGESIRVSWVLEFWRHMRARRLNAEFWEEVKCVAAEEMRADVALGIAIRVAEDLFGEAATDPVREWTVKSLPTGVALWVERYARRILLSDSLGSKLYLILRQQLDTREEARGNLRRLVFPLYLPPRLRPNPGIETNAQRWIRHSVAIGHFWGRLRFHCIEGARYVMESPRWQRAVERMELQ